jgi:hypothetical protein
MPQVNTCTHNLIKGTFEHQYSQQELLEGTLSITFSKLSIRISSREAFPSMVNAMGHFDGRSDFLDQNTSGELARG